MSAATTEPLSLLKPSDVAARLSVSRSKVYELLGVEIPFVRVGATMRIDPADVEAYIERQRGYRFGCGPQD